jgi:hypothetical protein
MERLKSSDPPLQELEWLWSRLSAWEPPQLSNRIARELISRMLAESREGHALRLVKERRAIDPGFGLQNRGKTLQLARVASQWSDRDLAVALLKGARIQPEAIQ